MESEKTELLIIENKKLKEQLDLALEEIEKLKQELKKIELQDKTENIVETYINSL